MFYNEGLDTGRKLGNRREALAALRQRTEREFHHVDLNASQRAAPLRLKLEFWKEIGKRAAVRLDGLDRRTRSLEEERDERPADYSVVKGLFYMLLAVFLVIADFSLLGQVMALFLNHSWHVGDDGTFVTTVFSDPALAIRSFPDLFFLVLSVLLLGFFLKAWRDVEDTAPEAKGRRNLRERIIFSVLLALALVSVVLMSTVRLGMSFDTTNPANIADGLFSPGFVSFFLGFSLPLVSAGFFIRGYDLFEKRYLLWRLAVSRRLLHLWLAWVVGGRRLRLENRISAEDRLIERSRDTKEVEKEVDRRRAEFLRGYGDGVKEVLSGGNLVQRLRPVILEKILDRSASQRYPRLVPVLLILALAPMLGACNSSPAAGEARPEPPRPYLEVIVFDPTIFTTAQADLMTQLADSLTASLDSRFSRGGRLLIFEVNRHMLHPTPSFTSEIERGNTLGRDAALAEDLGVLRNKLRASLVQSWEKAHQPEEHGLLNSCLLSALVRAGGVRQEFGDDYFSRLVVVTDLLEACADSGSVMNFQKRLAPLDAWLGETVLDLSGFDDVTLVQVRNDFLTTRQEDEALRQLWMELLSRANLPRDPPIIHRGVPERFDGPGG